MVKKKYFGYTVGEAPRYAYYPDKENIGIMRCPDINMVAGEFMVSGQRKNIWTLEHFRIGIQGNRH